MNNSQDNFDAARYIVDYLNLLGLPVEVAEVEAEEKPNINDLLDEHNDYLRLYNLFGDFEYLKRSENVMEEIKQYNS